MKKTAIAVLLCITLAFAAFVGGFYLGKNYSGSSISIQGLTQPPLPTTSTPATTSAKPTTKPPTVTTGPAPTQTTQPTGPLMININTATLEQLDLLPGIGPVIAQAIIDYRTEYGDFETVEDLLNVNGIGKKRLEAILEFITTGG